MDLGKIRAQELNRGHTYLEPQWWVAEETLRDGGDAEAAMRRRRRGVAWCEEGSGLVFFSFFGGFYLLSICLFFYALRITLNGMFSILFNGIISLAQL